MSKATNTFSIKFADIEQQAEILIVEDNLAFSKLLAFSVQKLGFNVKSVHSAEDALLVIHQRPISLILLDLILPEMSGAEFCQTVRQFSDVPIVVLSAINETATIVKLLDLGADEYIIKPCAFACIEAVITAQLRRNNYGNKKESLPNHMRIHSGLVTLDLKDKIAIFSNLKFHLTEIECKILECLIRKPEQPISSSEIYETVWGKCNGQEKTIVSTAMQRIRSKIESDPARPDFIVNVRGYGYKLVTRIAERVA